MFCELRLGSDVSQIDQKQSQQDSPVHEYEVSKGKVRLRGSFLDYPLNRSGLPGSPWFGIRCLFNGKGKRRRCRWNP